MSERPSLPLLNPQLWLRFAYMVLFLLLAMAARLVLLAVIALQFIWIAATGRDNSYLRRFGDSLASWLYAAVRYLTFNSQAKPFPFDEWPEPRLSPPFELQPEPSIAEGEFVAADDEFSDSDRPPQH
ncbi:DUF4389 domain-containing protein [Gammaproteobacteria bacterium LSUCC0057]|uniref:DUF4389 domain-containing protein n=1 Tax=Gammaproteobacteria bacterium LSUCC0057 TaxID=2559237 RepID=A0A4Y8UM95_9GAMM|nr:DUF4389 domain-containing protein [Gammaproteobacteria bacterium LSUCC0057]